MGTLPTPQVLLDDGTGTFPYDITSKVLSVDGYEVVRGREDWQGGVTAGQLTITLNNSDGRFTPGSTIIASPSPVKVDQRIRLKETVSGVTYTRFTGYAKSWPVSWPAVVSTFATVQLTATDAQARAERRTLRSLLEEEILSASPTAYYTLGEANGSIAAGDTSGNQRAPLTIAGSGAAVAFGNGTGPVDGLSAATLAGGKWLKGSTLTPSASYSELIAFSRATPPATAEVLLAAAEEFLILETSGKLALYPVVGGLDPGGNLNTPAARSANSVCDGNVHLGGWSVQSGVGYQLFIDGTTVTDADVSAGTNPVTVAGLQVGGTDSAKPVNVVTLSGTVSHVAHFDGTVLAAADVLDIWGLLSGVESGANRITRIAGYANIPVGTLDASLTDVTRANTSGQSAWQAIQDVADAEMGLVFIDGSGSLAFHNRNRVRTKGAPDLTLTSQWVTPDVAPVVDDQQILNYVEATAEGTGSTTVVRSTSSETTHGRYSGSQSYLVQTDTEALDRATWIVAKFAEPTARYGTLTINLFGMTAAQASAVLAALELDCWLRVTSLASQNPDGATADVVVQGFRADAAGQSWVITCNVVSRALYNVAIFNDPTFGIFNSPLARFGV